MIAFKLASVISVPLRACYHNCEITLYKHNSCFRLWCWLL